MKMATSAVNASPDPDIVANEFIARELGVDISISDSTIASVQEQLLAWYHENRRMLPWRGDALDDGTMPPPPSAYGTWVSEIMLQQTRVETVIPYWIKWMAKYPDVRSLAASTEDEVNALWAGLGYYRRAQSLLKGARKVVEAFDGVMPGTVDELKTVPGIGPYTAGAISSIAFSRVEPLVDGNVIRVLVPLTASDAILDEGLGMIAASFDAVA